MKKQILIWLLLGCSAFAVNRTVKSGGGGDCTVIQTCVNLMAAGDTTTVFTGTYAENVTVSAGTVGNYKTITVNGSDIVSVNSFTLGSHTQLVGNCTPGAAVGTCGFTFDRSASAGSSCLALSTNATDVFIRLNTLESCGTFTLTAGTTFIFVQGNTFAWAGCAPPTPGQVCGQWIRDWGDSSLIEKNDFSHYQLGGNVQGTKHIWRNNTFHDQLETEAGSNHHSDAIFMEPNFTTGNIVEEGNFQRNTVGSNAKGMLSQNDSCSPGPCTFGPIMIRFNTFSRLGSAAITNDKTWSNVKLYNNTMVDDFMEASITNGGDNMLSTGTGMSTLNNLWYFSASIAQGGSFCSPSTSNCNFGPVVCGSSSSCSTFGHSLYWCVGTCTSVHAHFGSSAFTTDSGNLNSDPQFVSYISPGNTSNDFHLQSTSPARNAGTSLTTVNGSITSSTSLVVTDATFFQDGFSLTNPYSTVQGDCIKVTSWSNAPVCITSINYATNTLALASPISATNGDAIWLASKSDGVSVATDTTGPDMGALPFSPTAGATDMTFQGLTSTITVTQ